MLDEQNINLKSSTTYSIMSQEMSRREHVEVLRASLYSLADSLSERHSDEQLRALDAEVARVSNAALPPPPVPVQAQAQAQEQVQAPVAQVLPLNPFSRFAAPAPLYVAPAQAQAQAQAPAQPRRHVAFAPAPAPAPAPVGVVFGFGPAPNPFAGVAAAAAVAAEVDAHRRASARTYAQRYRVSVERATEVLAYAERNGVHPDRVFERLRRRAAERAARASVAAERAAKKPFKKTTVVKIADLAVVNPDSCAVCMENHCKGDEVVTNCGHRFGSACFAQWETTQLRSNKVTCPCCRVDVTQLTGFRRRAAPKSVAK